MEIDALYKASQERDMRISITKTIKRKYKEYKWKKNNFPSAEEVIHAVFDLLTKEEIESMLDGVKEKTVEDFSMKKNLLEAAPKLRTNYSLEDSVGYARAIIEDIRNDPEKTFRNSRFYLARFLIQELFFAVG